MSNDGLLTSLANKLYLYKTKQSNSTDARTHARTHARTKRLQDLYWTSVCSVLELNCGSAWLKGVLETVHAHYTYIHISRAVKLSNVAKQRAASPRGYDHSGVELEVPTLPLLQSSSASQQLSVWLALGCDRW